MLMRILLNVICKTAKNIWLAIRKINIDRAILYAILYLMIEKSNGYHRVHMHSEVLNSVNTQNVSSHSRIMFWGFFYPFDWRKKNRKYFFNKKDNTTVEKYLIPRSCAPSHHLKKIFRPMIFMIIDNAGKLEFDKAQST